MTEFSMEALREQGEAFMIDISREFYLAYSGQKGSAELQPIYAKYARVLDADSLAFALETFKRAPEGSEERRSARLILDWQAESQSGRQLAELDEREIAWEASAVARVADGREIQYEALSIEIANSTKASERHDIEDARATLVGNELAPMKRERFQREREITEKLELAPNYNASFELLSGLSLDALRAECAQFLRDTQAMWDDTLPEFTKRVLGMSASEVTRADALALLRAREFDGYFPSERMEGVIRKQVGEMGIDALAGGRITLDTGDRPGKRSRAFCSPVQIPSEVYLVLRPHGGQTDWNSSCTSSGMRCTSRTCGPTCRSSIAGSATIRSPRATRCCSTT